ncbi:MAG: hypothetical protein GY899_08985 [Verrucomicrobiaceae bacterium]|nr:hypothetical protein [Verrucomicrobiaceae bacterium]
MGESLQKLLGWLDPVKAWRPRVAAMMGTVLAMGVASAGPDVSGGICDNCNGTGIVGDGTIELECIVCGGDGKIDPVDIEALEGASKLTTKTLTKREKK